MLKSQHKASACPAAHLIRLPELLLQGRDVVTKPKLMLLLPLLLQIQARITEVFFTEDTIYISEKLEKKHLMLCVKSTAKPGVRLLQPCAMSTTSNVKQEMGEKTQVSQTNSLS